MGTFKNGVHREVKPGRFASVLRDAAAGERYVVAEIRHDGFGAIEALYEAVLLGTIRVHDETASLLTLAHLAQSWPGNRNWMLAFWPTQRLDRHAFLSACTGELLSLEWPA